MLTIVELANGALHPRQGIGPVGGATLWLDLHEPTREEEATVEAALGIAVPTREEMQEIEFSSRLYSEAGAQVMTATVVYRVEAPDPVSTAVTFILAAERLVTVRYAEPKAFELFRARAGKGDVPCQSGAAIMIGLLEAIIDRTSDLVERLQRDTDRLAAQIFEPKGGSQTRSRRQDVNLKQVGHVGELISKVRESLYSLSRLLSYLAQHLQDIGADKALRARIKTELRDVQSLSDHIAYLAGRVTFLLDATLGMINIEQNQIIKLFSVVAVVMMPPTLVASIYGMNFKYMPELGWPYGYAWALGLMVVTAVLPYLYFKRKGWL
jgi:magnesium transporter